ncbi:MAG: 2-C-methyl-D-erythritol 4-phosphate cytidylyltransferase [Deltaproteobacteria bacterium]|nr:2-C-methyl-D-erythritol 4-phosphate cytidylyltransferase [Deltaproteobacteria bacterium]
MRTVAIIPAAGSGIRMGSGRAKQFLDLDGRPLLAVTLKSFQLCREVDAIILVVHSREVDYCRKKIVERFGLDKVIKVVPGGKRRQDSVRLGVEATNGDYGLVLIHDGVRPMIDEEFIEQVIAAAMTHRAVITGLPARETVKEIDRTNQVIKTYDRKIVWLVQTDDSLLVERLGIPVNVIEGSENNIKITTPHDLEMAKFLLKQKIK